MEKILCFFVLAVYAANALPHLLDTRITGGSLARENEFPYAVSIQQMNQLSQYTRGHRCGGVLITLRHVLTTASCTFSSVTGANPSPIIPGEFRVFAGSVVLTNDTSPERFRVVVNVTVHPNYTGAPAYANDIAILTLNNPFNNTVVTPMTVPPASFTPAEDAQCVVVGWGSENSTASASVNLRYARKYISSQKICAMHYNLQAGEANILPSMLCASSFDIVSTGCHGDFGNGLFCNGGLAGILSKSNSCSANSFPEVYTRVSNYTTWIRSVTGGASSFQPELAVLFMLGVVQLITAKVIS